MNILRFEPKTARAGNREGAAAETAPVRRKACRFSEDTCSGVVFRYVVLPVLAAIPLLAITIGIIFAIRAISHHLPWF